MSKTTVLLTGATGSLGATVLVDLLKDPSISVIAVVRLSTKSEPFLRSQHASRVSSGQLSFLEIPDMTTPGVFDDPATKADAIMHIATPLAYDNLMEKLVKPSWTILHNILCAADKSTRTKRVVVTGTLLSALRAPDDMFSGKTMTEADWNSITAEEAATNPIMAYQYSKVHAEQQAWKFMKEKARNFDLVFLLAPSILGKSRQGAYKPEKGNLGGQPGLFTSLFDVEKPGFVFPIFADIDDVSRIHVESLSPHIPGNERYIFHSHEMMLTTPTVLAIREEYPQLRDRVPAPETGADSSVPQNLVKTDRSKFEKAFGKQEWKSARVSALDTAGDLVAYFEAEKGRV